MNEEFKNGTRVGECGFFVVDNAYETTGSYHYEHDEGCTASSDGIGAVDVSDETVVFPVHTGKLNEKLKRLAKKKPAPSHWRESDEGLPF